MKGSLTLALGLLAGSFLLGFFAMTGAVMAARIWGIVPL